MRFKAQIDSALNVNVLLSIVQSFSRITKAKACMLRFTPSKVFILLPFEDQSMRIWTEVNQDSIFSAYEVQSQHPNNEVMIGLSVEHLLSALKSAANHSEDVTLQLRKHDNIRYLSFTISLV